MAMREPRNQRVVSLERAGNRVDVASRWALGEENLARHPSLRRKKAHDGQGRNRFAGTRFTDKAQNVAG
jgi:hypothetical protein